MHSTQYWVGFCSNLLQHTYKPLNIKLPTYTLLITNNLYNFIKRNSFQKKLYIYQKTTYLCHRRRKIAFPSFFLSFHKLKRSLKTSLY